MIEQSEGYKKLRAAIESDTKSGWSLEDRMEKLQFASDRARHYADVTGLDAGDILTAWESRRNYWYMNYYQDARQPRLDGYASENGNVRVFDNQDAALASIGDLGFRCPHCGGVSTDPYACNSQKRVKLLNSNKSSEVCNWKVYGLFGDLGKGVFVFIKSAMRGERIFKPIAWEEKQAEENRDLVEA